MKTDLMTGQEILNTFYMDAKSNVKTWLVLNFYFLSFTDNFFIFYIKTKVEVIGGILLP